MNIETVHPGHLICEHSLNEGTVISIPKFGADAFSYLQSRLAEEDRIKLLDSHEAYSEALSRLELKDNEEFVEIKADELKEHVKKEKGIIGLEESGLLTFDSIAIVTMKKRIDHSSQ